MNFFKQKPLIAFTIVEIIFCIRLSAQSNYIPSIIPPSPNAASLMKFTDIPVSPYTGTADVSIPIFTVQAKGVTVPIALSYHTGGIRIKEESGWVGLGWALNAGGMISRTILDKDDFDGTSYFTSAVPQLPGDISTSQPPQASGMPTFGIYFADFFCNYRHNTTVGTEDFWQAFTQGTPTYDLEPDIYNFSYPGGSGKFMITRDRKIILQKQENIRIQFETNGNSFTILDDQGNRFYFATKEYSQPATGGIYSISSWNLSQIITQKNDTVKFNYTTDSTWSEVAPDYFETYNAYCTANAGFSVSNSAGTQYLNQTLQSIDFTDGQVQFSFDGIRSDLKFGKKLNAIKIYSKNQSGLSYIKENDFYYSYFNPTATDTLEYKRLKLDSIKEISGSTVIAPYVFTYNLPQGTANTAKHGYNIDHWGFFNGVTNTTFIPSLTALYNPGVPVSDYFSYTGANREPDASTSATYSSAFSLQQIKYPTGGKTILGYEPNNYDFQKSIDGPQDFPQTTVVSNQTHFSATSHGTTSGTIDLNDIYPSLPSGSNTVNATLTISFRSSNNDCNVHYTNTLGKIYFNFTGPGYNIHEDISTSGLTCSSGSPVNSVNISLSITRNTSMVYSWSGYIDSTVGTDFQQIFVTLTWQEEQVVASGSPTLTGGGLRIKTITDYSSDSAIAKQRKYDYSYLEDRNGDGTPEQYSTGLLMSYPSYVRYNIIPTDETGDFCASLTLFGSSYTSLTSVIQGNTVGYGQVTEYTVNPATGSDLGKTVYNYFNSPDTVISYQGYRMPGTMNIGNSLNGILLSKTEYANAGSYYKKVKAAFNNYETVNRAIYYSQKYQYTGQGGYGGHCTIDTAVEAEALVCFYPSIKSERVLLDSTTDIIYDQNDTTQQITTSTRNFYDNPVHYQLSRSRSVNSKGNKVIDLIRYPQDYIPDGNTSTGNTILDSMINRNMVSQMVEKRDSLYYSGSSSGYVTGAILNIFKINSPNSIAQDKVYSLDLPGPVNNFSAFSISGNTVSQDSRYRQQIIFNNYDNVNNLLQYTVTDLVPVSFVWDYKQSYPVAQVRNTASNQIAYTSFEADSSGNWTISSKSRDTSHSITGRKSYKLDSGSISKSGLTSSSNYIISYWSQNGSYSISGTSSNTIVQGKTINNWTYYESAITTSSTTVIISGSGLIDELRLYPSGAQMVTYTYEPLIGITSQCDIDNRITYYEYDPLGRLKLVRDQDKNILKTYDYKYQANSNQ